MLVRLRSRDRLLLWVGVFSTLYGTRLFVQNELVRDAFNRPGNEYLPWALCITYLINIPFALFARELLGRGWKGSIAIDVQLTLERTVVVFEMLQENGVSKFVRAIVVEGEFPVYPAKCFVIDEGTQ
jgi:hypothetical protein